ncbi:hypothetical protein SteCoe_23263 [Stentor coeruleus]|uniref:Uncharacterized protein n=1 Tax=Stentor coeruleus TaxID=5963 RepID=A0A1R2BKA7_9CILI|nr:hypothetical protein SteCoe_23263 [Stentor coeruleus]
MSDAESKIKSLKESLRVREKELLAVFKELDHYRRKCTKLKLLLIKEKASRNSTVELAEAEEPVLPQKRQEIDEKPVESQVIKKSKLEHDEEDGEIKEMTKSKPQAQKKVKKTPNNKSIESLPSTLEKDISTPNTSDILYPEEGNNAKVQMSVKNPSPKPQTRSKSMVKVPQIPAPPAPVLTPGPVISPGLKSSAISPPAKKSVAYNQPYSIEQTQFDFTGNPTKPQPVSFPSAPPIIQKPPQIIKLKELFEIAKKQYMSDFDFNMNHLSLIADVLKTLDPENAACCLINEITENSFLFSPSDALSFLYGVMKELVRNKDWDRKFLNSFKEFYVKNPRSIAFAGKNSKLPGFKYVVSTLQDVLHTCFMILCQQAEYSDLISKLLAKLIAKKNIGLVKTTFKYWEEIANKDYAISIFYRLAYVEENPLNLIQELSNKSTTTDESMQNKIYLALKTIFRYITVEVAYNCYTTFLWPSLNTNKNSFTRTLVIKMIAILYQEIEKDGTKKVHNTLRSQLEEILTDGEMKIFSGSDQIIAAKALEKIGCQSRVLTNWKKSHPKLA